MPLHWPAKPQGQTGPYNIDWTGKIDPGDTIKTYTPSFPAGLTSMTITQQSFDAATNETQVWLSTGGTPNAIYTMTHVVVTNLGETLTETSEILVLG